MGRFIYDSHFAAEFDDRVLAHLQAVILAKVRRGESFSFTWKEDMSVGGGRVTVYVHPNATMVFKFHGSRQPQLNPAWLQALTQVAASARGLYVVPEPQAPPSPEQRSGMVFREVPRHDLTP